jgi:hypothetical protein
MLKAMKIEEEIKKLRQEIDDAYAKAVETIDVNGVPITRINPIRQLQAKLKDKRLSKRIKELRNEQRV